MVVGESFGKDEEINEKLEDEEFFSGGRAGTPSGEGETGGRKRRSSNATKEEGPNARPRRNSSRKDDSQIEI